MAYVSVVLLYSITALVMVGGLVIMAVMPFAGSTPIGISGVVGSLVTALMSSAMMAIPAYLALSRWWESRSRGPAFWPRDFRLEQRKGYLWGMGLIYVGHIIVLISLAIEIITIATHSEGVPAGLGLGFGLQFYAIGIICVELSFRGWRAKVFPNYRIERPREP